jgi:cytochrome c553
MALQSIVVALIVLACTAYAVWTLMPSAARRALATAMLRFTLPSAIAKPLQRATQAASGCGGCDGCGDAAPKKAPGSAQPLVFQRRLTR